MLRLTLIAAFVAAPALAIAAEAPPRPDPAVQALGLMVQQCSGREASALIGTIAMQAQVADLQAQVTAERKRAEDAEAKLAAAPKPEAPKTP